MLQSSAKGLEVLAPSVEDLNMQHGRYTVIRKLAEGGMAEIFLAKQHGSQGFEKPVVLKRIHAALYADEQFRNMLIDEAHVSMGLSHNNIVQVLDLGQAGGRYFLVLELVDGWDLGGVLRRAGDANLPLPPDLALYVVAQICRALGYAHAKTNADGKPLGIVHRDVSPQNVLISDQGEVKLADFGIAKARRKRESTDNGVVKGKIAFMSPEQALGQELDPRSDLYSLGTLLYLLVLGRRPFDGATDFETLLRVQNGQFTPPNEADYEAHPTILPLIDRAMQFDRELRYHSADEMLADVESVLRGSFGSPGQTEFKQWLLELGRRDGELPIGHTAVGLTPQGLAAEPQFRSSASLVLGEDHVEDTMLHTPARGERSSVRMSGAEPTVADLHITSSWIDEEAPRAIRSTQTSRGTTLAIMAGVLVALGGVAAAVWKYSGQAATPAPAESAIAEAPPASDAGAAASNQLAQQPTGIPPANPASPSSPGQVNAEAVAKPAPADDRGNPDPSRRPGVVAESGSRPPTTLGASQPPQGTIANSSPPPPEPTPAIPVPAPTPSTLEPSLVPPAPPAEVVPEPRPTVEHEAPSAAEPERREPTPTPAPPPSAVPIPEAALPHALPSPGAETVPEPR